MTHTFNEGLISINWTAKEVKDYGSHPVVWGVFDNQVQAILPVLNNNDAPTLITIDLGYTPSTNTNLVLVKAAKQTKITLTPNEVAEGVTLFDDGISVSALNGLLTIPLTDELKIKHGSYPFIACYFEKQYQILLPVPDDLTNPSSITVDLGAIPTTNTHLIIV